MKKYNRSEIMKRAWELVKKEGMDISSALKKSWREAKMKEEMAALKGSEKQVAWATSIREDAVNTLNGNVRLYTERLNKHGKLFQIDLDVFTELRDMVVSQIKDIDSAAKIIDIRWRLDPSYLLDMAQAEILKRRNRK